MVAVILLYKIMEDTNLKVTNFLWLSPLLYKMKDGSEIQCELAHSCSQVINCKGEGCPTLCSLSPKIVLLLYPSAKKSFLALFQKVISNNLYNKRYLPRNGKLICSSLNFIKSYTYCHQLHIV